MPRLAPRASALLLALALPALLFTGACSDDPAGESSYLLIELVPRDTLEGSVTAAFVLIRDANKLELTHFCVNLDGPRGEVVGSFVLERFASKPANERAIVEVTGFSQPGPPVGVGEEFNCDAPLMHIGNPAALEVDFCPGQAKVLRFNVGSKCSCGDNLTCGAGIGVDSLPCAADKCCSRRTPTACGLEDAN